MKKTLGVLLVCVLLIGIFAITGCTRKDSGSVATADAEQTNVETTKSESTEQYKLSISIDFTDADAKYKNIELFIDGESTAKLTDASPLTDSYELAAGSHKVELKNADDSSSISEATVGLDKNMSVTFMVKKTGVDCLLAEEK